MSARILLALAILGAAPLLLLDVAGAREHVSILTGQLPATLDDGLAGLAYVLAWFAAVLVAPIFAIAAALVFAADRVGVPTRDRRTSAPASRGTPPSLPSGPRR